MEFLTQANRATLAALLFCGALSGVSYGTEGSRGKGAEATTTARPDILHQQFDEGLDPSVRFGAAVELGEIGDERALAISAPASGATGQVFVYRQAGSARFALLDTLMPQETPAPVAFGKSLLLQDRYLFVVSDLDESATAPRIHVYRFERAIIFCLFPPCPTGPDIAGIVHVTSGAFGTGTLEFGDSLAVDDASAPDSYRLIIGDPADCQDEAPDACSGAVYFFEFDPFDSQLRQLAKIKSDFASKMAKTSHTPTRFGATIRARHGKVAIGAPGSPTDRMFPGSVDLFDLISGNLEAAGLVFGDETGDGFGDAADLSGEFLVVGAPGAKGGSGKVVAYPITNLEEAVEITTSEEVDASGFGSSIEVDDVSQTTAVADAENPYTDRPADRNLILKFSIRAILDSIQKGSGTASVELGSDAIVSSSPTGGSSGTSVISISSGVGLLAFTNSSSGNDPVEVTVSVPSLFRGGFEIDDGGIVVRIEP